MLTAIVRDGTVRFAEDGHRVDVPVEVLREVLSSLGEPDAEGWMHVEEVAAALGISVSTIRWWCANGTIKATKHGKRWAVRPSDLARFREGSR